MIAQQRCWGLAARRPARWPRRSGGRRAGYWRKRLELMNARRGRRAADRSISRTPSSIVISARWTKRSTTSNGWSRRTLAAACFSASIPAYRRCAGHPRYRGGTQAGGGGPAANGFSNAYSVDIIGTGTPARAARRTTEPCSASTSIRLPCDRSISSDDRIVPGMLGDVAVDPLDHVGRNIDAFGARHTFDLAACLEKLRADVPVRPERADRQPRAPVKPASADEKNELLPDRHAAVVRPPRTGCPRRERVVNRTDAGGRAAAAHPNTSPNTMRRCVPVCSMTPGRQCGGDVGRAADHRALADERGELPGAVDAVLNRQHRTIAGPSIGRISGSAAALSYALTATDDDIDRADLVVSSSAGA